MALPALPDNPIDDRPPPPNPDLEDEWHFLYNPFRATINVDEYMLHEAFGEKLTKHK